MTTTLGMGGKRNRTDERGWAAPTESVRTAPRRRPGAAAGGGAADGVTRRGKGRQQPRRGRWR